MADNFECECGESFLTDEELLSHIMQCSTVQGPISTPSNGTNVMQLTYAVKYDITLTNLVLSRTHVPEEIFNLTNLVRLELPGYLY